MLANKLNSPKKNRPPCNENMLKQHLQGGYPPADPPAVSLATSYTANEPSTPSSFVLIR